MVRRCADARLYQTAAEKRLSERGGGARWASPVLICGYWSSIWPALGWGGVRADGITSFSLIQNASDTRNGEALVIFQFDLLHVDGEDPSALPLVERKAS